MNSKFLTTNDAEAERAVMAATAITPEFARLAPISTGILVQVCADQNEAASLPLPNRRRTIVTNTNA